MLTLMINGPYDLHDVTVTHTTAGNNKKKKTNSSNVHLAIS